MRLGAPAGARVGEQVLDQPAHAVGAVDGEVDELVGVLVDPAVVAAAQQLQVAGDHPQRLGQVVRGDVGELRELGVGALERRDRLAPLGDVAERGHDGVAAVVAGAVVQALRRHARPRDRVVATRRPTSTPEHGSPVRAVIATGRCSPGSGRPSAPRGTQVRVPASSSARGTPRIRSAAGLKKITRSCSSYATTPSCSESRIARVSPSTPAGGRWSRCSGLSSIVREKATFLPLAVSPMEASRPRARTTGWRRSGPRTRRARAA